ncbi:MAG: glycosyltransferase family 2 protein [Burkholderiaceae bacterium]|nr:glycosyltransferase family 2 protein [Burkholderiaceae bacterium]
MKICAIILDYRGAGKTETCLRSLIAEGIDTVLVVDNSGDAHASAQLAEAVARVRSAGIDFALHLIEPGVNTGFARGVNLALADPAGQHCEAIMLLNNDAAAHAGAIRPLHDALLDGAAQLVGPMVVDDHGAPQPVPWYHRYFGTITNSPAPGAFPYLSGCCLMLRRSLLREGKLFDEDFFMYGEDALLGWQMARAHQTFKRINNATIRHTGQARSQRSTLFYEYQMTRAHYLLCFKTCRTRWEIPVLLVTKFATLTLRMAVRCIRYRSPAPLAALFLAWLPLDIRKAA